MNQDGSSPLRFYIVEDNAVIALDLSWRIEHLGHTVVGVAESADEAIPGILDTLPDCVLIDIMLRGDSDGIHVAEEITRRSPRPFAFLTAYSEAGIVERAGKTNPIAYLVKPVKDYDLLRVIKLVREATGEGPGSDQ
nr:response regulator [Methanocalculus sp. AMF5]